MKIFYNFDNMYNKKNIESYNNKIIANNTTNEIVENTILTTIPAKTTTDKKENIYELDKNVSLFDYSAKASSRYISTQNCSNIDCFEGITNPELPDNCMDYTNCLQYFNTMPIMNCIDNVPASSFLVINNQ